MSIARSTDCNQNPVIHFPFPLSPNSRPTHPLVFKTGSPSSSSKPYQPRAQSDSSTPASATSLYQTQSRETYSRTTPLALLRRVIPSLRGIPALLRGIPSLLRGVPSLLGRIVALRRVLLAVTHGRRLLVVSAVLRWRGAVGRCARRVGRAAVGRLGLLGRGSAVLGGFVVLAGHFGSCLCLPGIG